MSMDRISDKNKSKKKPQDTAAILLAAVNGMTYYDAKVNLEIALMLFKKNLLSK